MTCLFSANYHSLIISVPFTIEQVIYIIKLSNSMGYCFHIIIVFGDMRYSVMCVGVLAMARHSII